MRLLLAGHTHAVPPPPLDLADRCHPCWLPTPHTVAEHLESPDPYPDDLADYGIWPGRLDATLAG